MAFMLEVEFSGLCQFLVQRGGKQVGVVLPDARQNGRPVKPYDFNTSREYLVHHVGYLRYDLDDLADTKVRITTNGRERTPSYEVIHRFDCDDLDFGLDFDQPMDQPTLDLPNLSEFFPGARTRPGLFGATPPEELLMRTILRGGSLTTRPGGGLWKIDRSTTDEPYVGSFAGFAIWRRFVNADALTIRVREWGGANKHFIRLQPHNDRSVLRLKIANLCSENPLEWPELYRRSFTGNEDKDFRWFYFLWEHPDQNFDRMLKQDSPPLLPVPKPIRAHGDVENCTSALFVVDSVEGT